MLQRKKTSALVAVVLVLMAAVVIVKGYSDKKAAAKPENPVDEVQTTQATEAVTEPEPETQKYTEQQLEKMIAFSFDDGPGTDTTGRILDALEANGFTATFFVIGRNIDSGNAQNLKRAVEMGCEIGNHTWSHNLKLNSLAQSDVDSEIKDTNAKVKEITGVEPELVRVPTGIFSDLNVDIGYPIMNWTVDTNDWRKKGSAGNAQAASDLADYIMDQVDGMPGAIVLMHDIYQFTAETVETVMPRLAKEGYTVVSISELAEAYNAELKPNEVYRRIDRRIIIEPGEYVVSTGGSDPLSLRDEPSGERIEYIPAGTEITVTSEKDGWAEVTYDGQTGWVNSKYLAKQNETVTGVTETATDVNEITE